MTKYLTLLLFIGLALGQDSTLLISYYETYDMNDGDTLPTLPNKRNEFSYDINGNLIQNRTDLLHYVDNVEFPFAWKRMIYSYDNLNRNIDSTFQEANGFWANKTRWETIFDTDHKTEISFLYDATNSDWDTLDLKKSFFLDNGNIFSLPF